LHAYNRTIGHYPHPWDQEAYPSNSSPNSSHPSTSRCSTTPR